MKKTLIQIDSHANTRDKVELTKLCIKSLRPLGYPILVTSHIDIDDEVKELADYTYSDGVNVLLPDTDDIYYYYYSTDSFVMSFAIKNIEPHSPAAISSWQNGSRFAVENGFDYFLKVEYDFILETFEIPRLFGHIHLAEKRLGFFYGPNDVHHIAPKCIFSKSHLINDLLPKKIETHQIYYEYCDRFKVPASENRITGNFTYYMLKNYIDLFDRYYYNGDDYFKYNVPKNLQTNFMGFLCPLSSKDGRIFLCMCGLSYFSTTYKIFKDSNIIKSGEINFEEGIWYMEPLDLENFTEYKLVWYDNQIIFTKNDVLSGKFGTIEFF